MIPPRAPRRFLSLALVSLAACARPSIQVIEVPTEKEANEILVLLERYGVGQAVKQAQVAQRKTVWRVSIDSGRARAARYVLDRLGLPREERGGLSSALESGGVIPSAQTEQARLIHAESDKLARTLESHERILTARVHIVLPEEPIVPREGEHATLLRPTASIYLRYLRDAPAADGPGAPRTDGSHVAPVAPVGLAGVDPSELQGQVRALADLDPDAFARVIGSPPDRLAERVAEAGLGGTQGVPELCWLYRGYEPPSDSDWPLSRAEVVGLVSNAVEGLQPWDVEVVYSAVELEAATPSGSASGPVPCKEIADLLAADAARIQKLEQLDRPLGLIALLFAALSGFLFYLLRRERKRAAAQAED